MVAQVKVLVKGYTSAGSKQSGKDKDVERTFATITLVRDKNHIIVVDPGVLADPQILVDALKKEKLKPEDVNLVFLTHSHIDHYRNLGMFPKAKVLEYFGFWSGNTSEDWNENLSEDARIMKTPGHDSTGLSLIVKTAKGTVVIAGDVFWKENYPKKDPYADNPKILAETRKKILKIADFIVPGHADIYKVKRK